MSIEAEKFADDAAENWEKNKTSPMTFKQYEMIRSILNTMPLNRGEASELISKLRAKSSVEWRPTK
jgi:hypothetical protein